MAELRVAPLARFALACLALVAVAYVVIRPADGSPVPTSPAVTGTTEPSSPFGPVPATGRGAVRLDNGLVLPVTGGADGAWQVLTPCARPAVVGGEHLVGAHVVLDPGHGGRETGAVSPSGVVEAELNLDVARRVATRLEAAGATVVLTRGEDIRVTVQTRAALADALDPLALVSIHHNGGPTTPSALPGVEVFHQAGVGESARLGGLLWEEIREALAPLSDEWSSGRAPGVRARIGTDGEDFYGMLRRTATTAVLIEGLYLSSEPEATMLLEPVIRDAEAAAIAEAIVAWVGTRRLGSGYIDTLVADGSAGGGGGTEGCVDPPGIPGG